VAQWLRCCATNRKVAGSIPDGVIGIFQRHNPSDCTMALGVNSASNRNEYQKDFQGVNAEVRKAEKLTNFLCRCHDMWEP
jgi:2-keto-3-deoxy-L-rhamnonate aldolase RhmA